MPGCKWLAGMNGNAFDSVSRARGTTSNSSTLLIAPAKASASS
jgi:hypothetical protein